jgi:glycosyltransferase involved in cell wall biosynthesis
MAQDNHYRTTLAEGDIAQKDQSRGEGKNDGNIPIWSIIVIARNEEAVIGSCLKSVVDAFAHLSYELIVVDSASTDRTVEIARDFGARIVRLPATAPLRPSVGRHVGLEFSCGQWILFLDGDMVLDAKWVEEAILLFQEEPTLAGVAGEMEHIFPSDSDGQTGRKQHYSKRDYEQPRQLNGSAAYRRDALQRAGGFNPFLYSWEEAELAARLRKAGYSLRRLPIPMTLHFPKNPRESTPELFRRMRRGYFIGLGQFVRHSLKYNLPTRKWLLPLFRRYIEFFGLIVIGILAATASSITGQWLPISGWAVVMILIFSLFALRSGSIRKPGHYFLRWTLASPSVIWGFLKSPTAIHEFKPILDAIVECDAEN